LLIVLGEEQEQDQEQAQEGRSVREVLCWVHLQAHLIQWIFYITTIYWSCYWRSFLIRFPHGFLRNGQENLVLFQQLFYVMISAFFIVFYSPELSLQIRGIYPQVPPVCPTSVFPPRPVYRARSASSPVSMRYPRRRPNSSRQQCT
jgi:hypothetical protein